MWNLQQQQQRKKIKKTKSQMHRNRIDWWLTGVGTGENG